MANPVLSIHVVGPTTFLQFDDASGPYTIAGTSISYGGTAYSPASGLGAPPFVNFTTAFRVFIDITGLAYPLAVIISGPGAGSFSPPVPTDQSVSSPAFTITSVTPATGTIDGGMPVTVRGTGFESTLALTFGGAAVTNLVVVNSTTATCTTPAHAQGLVNIVGTQGASTAPITITLGETGGTGPFVYAVASGPSHGVLTGSAPNLTYTPSGGYSGPDAFTFTVADSVFTTPVSGGDVAITVSGAATATLVNGYEYIVVNLQSSPPWQTAGQWALHQCDIIPTKQGPTKG